MMSSLIQTAVDTVVETAKETVESSKIVKFVAAGIGGALAGVGICTLINKKSNKTEAAKGSEEAADNAAPEKVQGEVVKEKAAKKAS